MADIIHQEALCVFMSVLIKHYEYIVIHYKRPDNATYIWSSERVNQKLKVTEIIKNYYTVQI